jgi:endonuclease/exonuclease/phosphatase family metal-dependent hydrolase
VTLQSQAQSQSSSPSLQVTTWNVLHRIHAVNWNESPRELFPDESVRIEKISALVLGLFASGNMVVCLQEVSGDQLASLRSVVGGANVNLSLFHHEYPRVPKLRIEGPAELADRTEHLVTLVAATTTPTQAARHIGAQTFARDPGKGHLVVDVGGVAVINTHVTYGKRRDEQLASVAFAARSFSGTAVVIVGDFNSECDSVRSVLGEGFELSDVIGQRPTRVATPDKAACSIDHVVVLRGRIESATVLDAGGLSDHNPVVARVVY